MSNASTPGSSTTNSGFSGDLEARLQWFRQEFIGRHGTKLAVVAGVIAVAIFAYYQYSASQKAAQLLLNETLGKGYQAIMEGKTDSAQAAFAEVIAHGKSSDLQKAKAALMLGNLRLQARNLDGASEAYGVAISNAHEAVLLKSGAAHGLAVVAMEKKDYPQAAKLLEDYAKEYGKRTGNLEDRYAKSEPSDPVTLVPDALWKLTLVYNEMKDAAKAKETAERLVKVYGDSPIAAQARKFLATL